MQTPATPQIFMMKRWIQWNEKHLWINRKAISHILYTIYFKWQLPELVEPTFLLLLFIGSLCSKGHCYSHANTNILVQVLYKNFKDFLRLLRWMAVKTGSNIGKNITKLTTSSSESSRPCILLFSLTACWCFFPLMWLKRYTSDEICNDNDITVIFFLDNSIIYKLQYFKYKICQFVRSMFRILSTVLYYST